MVPAIKYHCNAVLVRKLTCTRYIYSLGMLHDAEPCTMAIDVFNILHNYSNIVSFYRISRRKTESIYNVNECKTHIHDAHIDLYIQPVH